MIRYHTDKSWCFKLFSFEFNLDISNSVFQNGVHKKPKVSSKKKKKKPDYLLLQNLIKSRQLCMPHMSI